MADIVLDNARVQNKHDTEAKWNEATSFIPKNGEIIIYDEDSTHTRKRVKIGNGRTVVASLPFFDDTKVDKVSGKGLSTNDYTTAEKNKLSNISESADAVSFTRSLTSGTKVGTITINGTGTDLYAPTNTDTKNTAGATNTNSMIYLIGATSQDANPQTYSHDTVYVTSSGKLVSNGYILGDTATYFKTGLKSSKSYTFPKETSQTYYVVLKSASSFDEQKFMFQTTGNNTNYMILATINARIYMGATIHGQTLRYNGSEISKIAVYKNTSAPHTHDIVLAIKTNSTTTTTLQVFSDGDFDLSADHISTTAPTGTEEAFFIPDANDKLFSSSRIYSGEGFEGNLYGTANVAKKLSTSSAGSSTQPVYFSNGVPSAISYTISKSVPADAVFTDIQTRQQLYSQNYNLPLLMSYAANNNATANVDNLTFRNNSIYANPNSGTIAAKSYKVNEHVTLQYDSTNESLNFVFS